MGGRDELIWSSGNQERTSAQKRVMGGTRRLGEGNDASRARPVAGLCDFGIWILEFGFSTAEPATKSPLTKAALENRLLDRSRPQVCGSKSKIQTRKSKIRA
jgi:hypothetical protein